MTSEAYSEFNNVYGIVASSNLPYNGKVKVLKGILKENFDSMELSKAIYCEKIRKGKVTEKYYFEN